MMKYCLIFYFYLAVATKDYTRHHKVGYSLDVDDDFSKIAVISHTFGTISSHGIGLKFLTWLPKCILDKTSLTTISANSKVA